MNSAQHHVVRREVVDVGVVGSEAGGLVLQRRLADLCGDDLAPALDAALGRIVPADEHWVLERLDVDAGSFTSETLERDFVRTVTAAVERLLRRHIASSGQAPWHEGSRAADRKEAAEHKLRQRAATAAGTLHRAAAGRAAGATSRNGRDATAPEPVGGGGEPLPGAEGSVEAGLRSAAGPADRDEASYDGPGAAGSLRRLSHGQSVDEACLHFISTGVLPWWFHLPDGQTLEQVLLACWADGASEERLAAAVLALMDSPTASMRLVRQFSPLVLERLLRCLSPPVVDLVREAFADLARREIATAARQDLGERLWQTAFQVASSGGALTPAAVIGSWLRAAWTEVEPDVRPVISSLATAWPEAVGTLEPLDEAGQAAAPAYDATTAMTAATATTAPAAPAPPSRPDFARPPAQRTPRPASRETPAAQLDLDEGIFVECAGLVLLHPFLPTLFERLEITTEDRLLLPDRALALLHFLATGTRSAPEYALPVPKLLCGLDLKAPVGAPVELRDDEVAEAGGLLTSAIGHWTALGSTGPDALRGTFLTRPGKLSRRADDHLLQVEPQSFDILLDRLPWGLGPIRLPWMVRMLWVEWRM